MKYFRYVDREDGWEWIAPKAEHGKMMSPIMSKPPNHNEFHLSNFTSNFGFAYYDHECKRFPIDEKFIKDHFEAFL